jgi:alpha-glucosidase
VPTVWDETVVPGASVGEWVCIARRKGTDWYVGTINNSTRRTCSIPLSFLSAGNYRAEIYKDAPDVVSNPNKLIKESKEVNSKSKLELVLPAGGGQVIRLTSVK